MNIIRKFILSVAILAMIFGLGGCVVLDAGVGAVTGSGTAVGVWVVQ